MATSKIDELIQLLKETNNTLLISQAPYPYTNFHSLNLDWLLQEMKLLSERVATLQVTVAEVLEEVQYVLEKLPEETVDELLELLPKMQELETLVNGYNERITTNTNDITQIQSDISGINTKISNIQSDISNLQTTVAAHTSDITTLKTDNTTNKSNISALQTDNTKNKTDISALQTDNTTNKTNISNLQSTVDNHSAEIAVLKISTGNGADDISELMTDVTALKADNTTNKSNISNLQTTVAGHTSDITTLKADNTTNKSNISALQTDNTQNKANIATLQQNTTLSTVLFQSSLATAEEPKLVQTSLRALSFSADSDNFTSNLVIMGGIYVCGIVVRGARTDSFSLGLTSTTTRNVTTSNYIYMGWDMPYTRNPNISTVFAIPVILHVYCTELVGILNSAAELRVSIGAETIKLVIQLYFQQNFTWEADHTYTFGVKGRQLAGVATAALNVEEEQNI